MEHMAIMTNSRFRDGKRICVPPDIASNGPLSIGFKRIRNLATNTAKPLGFIHGMGTLPETNIAPENDGFQ